MTDPARALQEAELTSDEIERILRVCGPRALLVGGQALAAWAVHYGIQPVGELSRSVTMDADFIGTSDTAQALQRSLGSPWKLRKATFDDAGEQVAKVGSTGAARTTQLHFEVWNQGVAVDPRKVLAGEPMPR